VSNEPSGFVALALGRLVSIKGLDLTLRACAQAKITLLVAGEGPELASLRTLATTLHVDVRFLGNRVGLDKSRLFRAADVLIQSSRVLPSGRTEGMPTVVLEALSHALPVIATTTGGVPELLKHGRDGWLVPPDDVSTLASALGTLRDDPALRQRLGQQGLALGEAHLWPVLAPRIESLLGR
jgi:colanic acid/amylovoran biosynthesis glycosyltransferase